VDKANTGELTSDGHGITVGLLYRGTVYPDDLGESEVLYHYPNTNRPPSRDYGEIWATKAAKFNAMPLFVITQPETDSKIRDVYLGWVEDWDDQDEVFLVSFDDTRDPAQTLEQPDEWTEFILTEVATDKKTPVQSRSGQQRFSYLVFQRYGDKCAVCDIDIPELLDAAHIKPKKFNGSDDPRNGLVLCALHHRALDAGLYCINSENLEIHTLPKLDHVEDLNIVRINIGHLNKKPHKDALGWLWNRWIGNE